MFNWQKKVKQIKQYIDSADYKENDSTRTQLFNMVYPIIREEPFFSLNEEVSYATYSMGYDYLAQLETPELVEFIKLPFDKFNISLDFSHEHIDRELYSIKLENDVIYVINTFVTEPNFGLEWAVFLFGLKPASEYKFIYERCAYKTPKKLAEEESDRIGKLSQNIMSHVIGLALALNTKEFLTIENKAISGRFIRNENNERTYVQDHAYKQIKLSLRGKQYHEQIKNMNPSDRNAPRMHMRRGHFKQRRNGVYWWNAHLSAKKAEYSIKHDYEVK